MVTEVHFLVVETCNTLTANDVKHVLICLITFLNVSSYMKCLFRSFAYFLFVFSRAAPLAHGGSQARGLIGAVASGLHHSHSNLDPSHVFDLHCSSWQRWILNPLSEARD